MSLKEEFEKMKPKKCRYRSTPRFKFIGPLEKSSFFGNTDYIVLKNDCYLFYTKQEFKDLYWEEIENDSKNNPFLDEIPEVYVRRDE